MVALEYEPPQCAVLITDDDEACRSEFREILEGDGYETFLARTGTEAIRIVRRRSVHVAILEMHTPGMSGLETLAGIRIETRQNVPAVLVSRDASKELQLKALVARFEAFLSKPVDHDVLRTAVERIVRRYYPGGIGPDE